MKNKKDNRDKKELIKGLILLIPILVGLIWYAIFSPWAKYEPTEKELYEAAVQYDIKHGTNYASDMHFDPNWYINEND